LPVPGCAAPIPLEETLPNVKSAEKRMRTSAIRADRNRQYRSRLRTALKKVRQADDAQTGAAALQEAARMLDKAAAKRIIHPNKAARAKSRLTAMIRKLDTAAA
jgi:small subunit ribosomal protein S20